MADDSVEGPNINLNNVHKLNLYLIERPASSLQRTISQCSFKEQINFYCEEKDKSTNTTTVQSAGTLSKR